VADNGFDDNRMPDFFSTATASDPADTNFRFFKGSGTGLMFV
jgi:hypothetical protein